tara:strand:- start:381 stop:689 length:309 start_codon:yes stop_codon:yes gene_type:complete
MKTYKRTTKPTVKKRGEMVIKISELAEQIRDGEEDLLEEYNKVVKEFADITRQQAAAEETDPIMWDTLCEDWGEVPTETIQYGGKRAMNYMEMTKFVRGYWR